MKYACIILSLVACPALQNFSTLFHKRHDFRKTLLSIKCVFWFSLQRLSETFLILTWTEGDMAENVHWSSRKMHAVLPRFWRNLNLLGTFSKKHSNIKFNENPSSRSRVIPCWRTDRNDEANSRLRNSGDVSNEIIENVSEKKNALWFLSMTVYAQ